MESLLFAPFLQAILAFGRKEEALGDVVFEAEARLGVDVQDDDLLLGPDLELLRIGRLTKGTATVEAESARMQQALQRLLFWIRSMNSGAGAFDVSLEAHVATFS